MSYKVLVVDDSKLARMVMASAFRRIRPEWTLVQTANADEALAAVGTVDIALIDFNMPGTDGLELVARIRKSHPSMPVAVVSANIQDEIIGRARQLNAGFIPKPLTDEALAAFHLLDEQFGDRAGVEAVSYTHLTLPTTPYV